MHRLRATDADLWILIFEELRTVHQEGLLVRGVECVKAHRSKEEMQKMSRFEKFTAEGIEKADEFAKDGGRLDGGDMAQVRAVTMQQEREGGICSIGICRIAICSSLPLSGGGMERL